MAMIYVRTKQGRAAFYEGRIIPQDKFIPVTDDPWIRRLIHYWGDIEVEGGEAAPEAAEAKRRTRRQPAPDVTERAHGVPSRPHE